MAYLQVEGSKLEPKMLDEIVSFEDLLSDSNQ